MLNFQALAETAVTTTPFPYLIVPQFVTTEGCAAVHADFPKIQSPGSFPISELDFGPQFQNFINQIHGEQFRQLVADKFQLSLDNLATTMTVRGRTGTSDGKIHTDTKSKIITVLIYLNGAWEEAGGRLRLLNSPDDINDYAAEVPPSEGTLLAFKVTPNGWHGHLPFIGERRSIQFNWVTEQKAANRAIARHRISAKIKKATAWVRGLVK